MEILEGIFGLYEAQKKPPVQPVKITRTVHDITTPIFCAEAAKRKILTVNAKCKSNWIGNGFHKMVYELLFFALEELKIVHDTGHQINGEYLYVINTNLVNKENLTVEKLRKTDFKAELECYTVNEKELYDFLLHYKHKVVANRNATNNVTQKKNVNKANTKKNTNKTTQKKKSKSKNQA
jgi:hypothetical protein